MPVGSNFIGNDISFIAGSGISLGDNTYNTTISGNNIHDIVPVSIAGQEVSIGVQANLSTSLMISDNSFSNLSIASNLLASTASLSNNSYSGLVGSYLTTTVPNLINFTDSVDYWVAVSTIPVEVNGEYVMVQLESFASSLAFAGLAADSGSTIIGPDGSDIVEDCADVWGGESFVDSCEQCVLVEVDGDEDGIADSCDACPLDADNDIDGDVGG